MSNVIAVINHGEGASVINLVDASAPEGEQPAIVASFKIGAMKLADLKRIPVGTKLLLVHSLLGPCMKARTVAAVHSNALEFTGDDVKPGPDGKPRTSWLYFPKASNFKPEGDGTRPGFTIYETDDYTKPDAPPVQVIAARYVFMTGQDTSKCLRCPETIPAARVVQLCDACIAKSKA